MLEITLDSHGPSTVRALRGLGQKCWTLLVTVREVREAGSKPRDVTVAMDKDVS